MSTIYKATTTALMLAISVFLVGCSSSPMPEALKALANAEEDSNYYFFESKNNSNGLCYVFYPGGRVKPEAYAPYMKAMSDKGVHSFLLRPMLELAFLNVGVADSAFESKQAKEHCTSYFIGGHSFGGLATASFGMDNPKYPLLIIGSYIHTEGLENYPHPVMYIYGDNDLLVINEIEEKKGFAPAQTIYRPIEGGNHALMGYYGEQKGDGQASISREEQQQALVNFTNEFIAGFKTQ